MKPDAVSLLGWSNGGSTVLYAANRDVAPSRGGADFARAIAFYPGCRVPAERGWRDRVPLLILVGADDDWTGAEPCDRLAAAAKARGEAVEIVVYPGAVHDFDHPNAPRRQRTGLGYTRGPGGTAQTGTDPTARADAIVRVAGFLAQ